MPIAYNAPTNTLYIERFASCEGNAEVLKDLGAEDREGCAGIYKGFESERTSGDGESNIHHRERLLTFPQVRKGQHPERRITRT